MTQRILILGFGLTLGCVLYGCGGNDCGAGTVEADGTCVPVSTIMCGPGTAVDPMTGDCVPTSTLECAMGTIEMDGMCVPDGSVICTGATIFDAATGTCIPDPDAICAGDTVFDMTTGTCVTRDSTLVASAENQEGMEPNDLLLEDAIVVDFNLPNIDETTTFGGCITPSDFDGDGTVDVDNDSWTFAATAPVLLEISVDGIGGLAGGFGVLSSAEDVVAEDAWVRFGVDLANDGVSRQVFIPAAGNYVINFGDSRSLLLDQPAGGAETCYFGQVTARATPAATALPAELTAMGTNLGDPEFYSLTATEGQLLFPTLSEVEPNAASAPSLVILVDGTYRVSNAGNDEAGNPVGGLLANQEIIFVMDNVFNYAPADVAWEFEASDAGAQAAPTDGTAVTLDHSATLFRWMYVDVTAGDVARLEIVSAGGDFLQMDVINPRFTRNAGLICSDCDSDDVYLHGVEGGRYYIRVFNNDLTDMDEGMTYDVNVTQTDLTVQTHTVGTDTAVALSTAPRGFIDVNTGLSDWLSFDINTPVGLTGADLTFYNREDDGILDSAEVGRVDADTADGAGGFGRIYIDESDVFLIGFEDDDTYDGTETFNAQINDRAFTDLGAVSEGAAIAPAASSIPPTGETAYFLVRPVPFSEVTITATPSGAQDLVIDQLDDEETVVDSVDDGGASAAESLVVLNFEIPWVPFAITQDTATAADADVGVTSLDPPYEQIDGALPYVDVCAAGTELAFVGGVDDGVAAAVDITTAGLAFSFFGVPVTEAVMSTNGWMTFDAWTDADGSDASPDSIPNMGGPNNLIAPYWQDLDAIVGCVLVEADKATFQWEGERWFGNPIQFQVVLHMDGSIDFIYGEEHVDISRATVGIENDGGSFGLPRLPLNSADEPVLFNTSVTFRPRS